MSFQAQIVLILWLPIILFFFTKYPPRKAIIVSILGGLLFLPQKTTFALPLIPDYEGMIATYYGIFIGIIIFDSHILDKFKFHKIDIPILLFGIAPLFSSLSNGLGFYDGINQSIAQTVKWGMPYFLGRLYFNNFAAFKELSISIVKAGLLYLPFCLYEIRMSPQLHKIVYGEHAHSFAQTIRYDGWRPQVFMQHGLMLGLFMMVASLTAIWLWQAKVVKKIWTIPIEYVCVALFITFVLCKSTGAYALMIMGLSIMLCGKFLRLKLPLLLIVLGVTIYLIISASGNLNLDNVISFISDNISPDRAQSLEFRLSNEELLGEKARYQLLFGWGGWGRNRVYAEDWAGDIVDISITDSLWIIIFGINGLFGLVNYVFLMTLPIINYGVIKTPTKSWFKPHTAPTIALTVVLTLALIDWLFNFHFNPLFPLIAGGLSSLSVSQLRYSSPKIKKYRKVKQIYSSTTSQQTRKVS